jgi:uncharacterized membrane protein YeaQ/YmgE (transglycosylase-associated protein family)
MDLVLPLLLGLLIGWLASLAMHTGTQAGILLDLAVGAAGAILLSQLLGEGSTFDNLVAAALGALVTLAILALVRRLMPKRHSEQASS